MRRMNKMRRMNIGCCIGRNYVGVVGYADDLSLVAPCIDGLQEMLKVCEKYAEDHNLKFSTDVNPNKSNHTHTHPAIPKHSLTAFSIVMRTGLFSGICTGKKQACSSTPGVLLLGKCTGLIEERKGISYSQ